MASEKDLSFSEKNFKMVHEGLKMGKRAKYWNHELSTWIKGKAWVPILDSQEPIFTPEWTIWFFLRKGKFWALPEELINWSYCFVQIRGCFVQLVDKRLGMVATCWKDSGTLQVVSTVMKKGIDLVQRRTGANLINVRCPNDIIM